MLEVPFFNFHDIIIITVILECILIAGLLVWTDKGKRVSNALLASFLLADAAYLIDTITYWNLNINAFAASVSTNFFFWLGFASLLKGPFLFWYTKSFIFRDFKLTTKDIIHLLPALIYPFYMYIIFYQHDEAYKLAIIQNYDVLIANNAFKYLRWFQDFAVIIYGVASLSILHKHKTHLAGTYSKFTDKEYRWLQILIIGFLFIWVWIFLSYLQVWITDWTIPIGTIGNYFNFILLNTLLVYGLSNSNVFDEVPPQFAANLHKSNIEQDYPYVDLLKTKMEHEKLFTRKNLTLERLAEELEIPVKSLSKTINGHFQMNFFEFISYYRVEEAKKLLVEHPNMTVQVVMEQSGFRSKSAFNRFFLKYALSTPSVYRKNNSV